MDEIIIIVASVEVLSPFAPIKLQRDVKTVDSSGKSSSAIESESVEAIVDATSTRSESVDDEWLCILMQTALETL